MQETGPSLAGRRVDPAISPSVETPSQLDLHKRQAGSLHSTGGAAREVLHRPGEPWGEDSILSMQVPGHCSSQRSSDSPRHSRVCRTDCSLSPLRTRKTWEERKKEKNRRKTDRDFPVSGVHLFRSSYAARLKSLCLGGQEKLLPDSLQPGDSTERLEDAPCLLPSRCLRFPTGRSRLDRSPNSSVPHSQPARRFNGTSRPLPCTFSRGSRVFEE